MPVPIGRINKCNCGGFAFLHKEQDFFWFVQCEQCENRTKSFDIQASALRSWNTRVKFEGYNSEDDWEIPPDLGDQ